MFIYTTGHIVGANVLVQCLYYHMRVHASSILAHVWNVFDYVLIFYIRNYARTMLLSCHMIMCLRLPASQPCIFHPMGSLLPVLFCISMQQVNCIDYVAMSWWEI